MRGFCVTVSGLLFLVVVGCVEPEAKQARVASLTGVPEDGLVVQTSQNGLYNVHDVQTAANDSGFTVSGHVGPPARTTDGPKGHVDVDVVSPDGKVVASASAPLDPVSASPRVFVERRFHLSLPSKPAAGSELRVNYHAGNALCHAEG